MNLPAPLTTEESFSHTRPHTRGAVRYLLTPVTMDGYGTCGVIVGAGDTASLHDLCRRCGAGFGHHLFNGDDDICYECGGDGYGRDTTADDLIRRVSARIKRAERAERKRREAEEAAAAAYDAWVADNGDLVDALRGFLPKMVWDNYGGEVRATATTFLADLAVRVIDGRAPLTPKQEAAARTAIDRTRARHEETVAAGHFGTVGERVDVTVKIVGRKRFDGDFGPKFLVTMKTSEGHTLKTWSSGTFGYDAEEGEEVTIRGTITAHGEYRLSLIHI